MPRMWCRGIQVTAWRPSSRRVCSKDVTDVWKANNLDDQLKSAVKSMEIDGKKWGIPYSYYQWGIYYRKDIFEKQGIQPPKTWAELLAACEKLKKAGITPFTIGTKALWPTGGWFDYLDLRVNGFEFHMDLTAGKIPYTDPRVKAVFTKWAELVKPGYFIENHAGLDWQDAIPQMVQGKAAMYLMGNFAVAPMKDGGLKEDQIASCASPRSPLACQWRKRLRRSLSTFHPAQRTRRMRVSSSLISQSRKRKPR